MSSTSINLPANFQDAKMLMDLIVNPALLLIEEKLQTHTDKMETTAAQMGAVVGSFNGRVSKLEQNQKYALWGWGVIAAALAAAPFTIWGWVKSHLMRST